MASSYLQLGPGIFWPTFRLRKNTYKMDDDIKKDPGILAEREMYEERKHLESEIKLKVEKAVGYQVSGVSHQASAVRLQLKADN